MILVTGSDGFIARHLIKKLEKQEYEVYKLDREPLRRANENMTFKLNQVPWSKIRRIYHLGAITDTTETDTELLHTFNVKFSIDMFKKAKNHRIPVHYASSAAVYGNLTNKINPLNEYAISKLSVDMWVSEYMSHTDITGFRFFNVYGPEENKKDQTSIVSKFIDQAKRGETMTLFEGSENIYRDCIHVDDVIEILTKRYEPNNIYDVGTGHPQNILDIAKMIRDHTGVGYRFIDFPEYLKSRYQFLTEAINLAPGMDKKKYIYVRDWIKQVL